MKKFLKILGKLVLLSLVLLFSDVIMTYTLDVSYTYLQEGIENYYFEMGVLRILFAMLGFYLFVGGWAYLLAAILYYFCRSTELLHHKFKYIIGLALLFYISITYTFYGISPVLLGYFLAVTAIYYVLVKRQMFGEYLRKTALWYVIFLLFFFFYWLSSSLQPKMLILQLIVYIPLAWIGQKVYSKLFKNRPTALA